MKILYFQIGGKGCGKIVKILTKEETIFDTPEFGIDLIIGKLKEDQACFLVDFNFTTRKKICHTFEKTNKILKVWVKRL